jgi:hypothetical protein
MRTAFATDALAGQRALRVPLVEQFGDDVSMGDLSTAIVRPFAATVSRDSFYVSFLARLMADHNLRALTSAGTGAARPSCRLLNEELRRRLAQGAPDGWSAQGFRHQRQPGLRPLRRCGAPSERGPSPSTVS